MKPDEIRYGMRVRRVDDDTLRNGIVREVKKMCGVPAARVDWPKKPNVWHPVSLLEKEKKA